MAAGIGGARRHHGAIYRNAARIRIGLLRLVAGYRSDRLAQVIILGLVLIDLIFVELYLLKYTLLYFDLNPGVLRQPYFDLDSDRGYAELFNYLQVAICVALLLDVFTMSRQYIYAAWTLVFSFVLADDALLIHEKAGQYLVSAFALPTLPGLRPVDTGELLTWCIAAAFLLGVLAWAFRNSTPEAIGFGGVFALIFACLIFFGVGVDMAHVVLGRTSYLADRLLVIVEDGGEMLTLTLACASALLLYRRWTIGRGELPMVRTPR